MLTRRNPLNEARTRGRSRLARRSSITKESDPDDGVAFLFEPLIVKLGK
jgi:hypothetical protein